MEKELLRKCPICQSDKGKILGDVKMALSKEIKLPAQYDIVACCECGFTFADTSSNQEDYNDYYASDNCYADEGEVKNVAKMQSISSAADFFEKYVGKKEKILDIGCGSGDMLNELKARGFQSLFGLDPSAASIEYISNKGINGIVGNIFDEPNEEIGKFDVVISTCVMEHICDLNGFIENVKQYINQDGKIYIVVPAVEGFEKYYQSKPNYFNHEHINYFSKMSMANLFGKHGLLSLTEDNGEFYEVIPPNGIADVMVQNIFQFRKEYRYKLKNDEVSSKSIENYLIKDKDELKRKYDLICELRKLSKKCIVWGAGSMSMQMMLDETFAEQVVIMVDNNKEKWGRNIAGIRINAPEILYDEEYRDLPIVVICMQYSTTIVKQINEMGLENKVIVY